MNKLATSTTDQIGAPSRLSRLLSNQDITESIGDWLHLSNLPSTIHGPCFALQWTLVPWRPLEATSLPQDKTERFVAVYSCVIPHTQNPPAGRFAPQENSSDLTYETAADFADEAEANTRWMGIVREEFGAPNEARVFEYPGLDLIFEDKATADCVSFCNEHRVLGELRTCLGKAEELFSGAVSVSADYDSFPPDESDEIGHVVINVQVRSDQDTAIRDYERYADWMLDAIPLDATSLFVVMFSRVGSDV